MSLRANVLKNAHIRANQEFNPMYAGGYMTGGSRGPYAQFVKDNWKDVNSKIPDIGLAELRDKLINLLGMSRVPNFPQKRTPDDNRKWKKYYKFLLTGINLKKRWKGWKIRKSAATKRYQSENLRRSMAATKAMKTKNTINKRIVSAIGRLLEKRAVPPHGKKRKVTAAQYKRWAKNLGIV